jgi:hypothetical protein
MRILLSPSRVPSSHYEYGNAQYLAFMRQKKSAGSILKVSANNAIVSEVWIHFAFVYFRDISGVNTCNFSRYEVFISLSFLKKITYFLAIFNQIFRLNMDIVTYRTTTIRCS